jgi:hypothetical protein
MAAANGCQDNQPPEKKTLHVGAVGNLPLLPHGAPQSSAPERNVGTWRSGADSTGIIQFVVTLST